MGSKYPVIPPEDIIRVIQEFEFEKVSQKGSHAKYVKSGINKKVVIIPMHYEIAKGTLKSILEQAGITIEEFLKFL